MPPTAVQMCRPTCRTLAISLAALALLAGSAVCAVWPHEQCEVAFVGDPADLHADVIAETGPVDDPVYLCPCHNSAFTVDAGRRLGGPAPRGLYRFRVTDVTANSVVIGEVEEDVLPFF